MKSSIIAIDVMGGDGGPQVTIPACLQVLKQNPHVHFKLFGDRHIIERTLAFTPPVLRHRLSIIHASDVISMSEKPSAVLRQKKPSSMWLAIDAVRQGEAAACVSAGNTGAMMALGMKLLGRLATVQRPAICTAIPARNDRCYLLDMGANVDCSAEVLLQYAQMGSCLVECIERIDKPKVALLNIGEEAIKGNAQVQRAAELLDADENINFIGYVEGHDLYLGGADVVVCDGFVGNIALKTSEGVARFIRSKVGEAFGNSWLNRLMGLLTSPILNTIYKRIDPRRFNGASFLGIDGILVKSHGNADVLAFRCAVQYAIDLEATNVLSEMRLRFELQS